MITAYFTKTTKYLQKDDYRKDFDVSSLAELIGKIKVKESVLIKASSKDIFDFKFKSGIECEFEYEVVSDILSLTPDIVRSDLQGLRSGTLNYVVYKPKNKDLLGDKCYLVANRQWQKWFIKKGDMALTLDDIKDLDFKKVVKIMFDGKEIEQCTN